MRESIAGQSNGKRDFTGRTRVVVWVWLNCNLERIVLADQVLTVAVHEGERASVFRIKRNCPDANALFSIVLDQPGFVLAPLRR